MDDRTPMDALSLAHSMGLDPWGRGVEKRIKCPHECHPNTKRRDYSANLNTSPGDKHGLYHCHRCHQGGRLRDAQGTAPKVERPITPPPPRPKPIDAAQAWTDLSRESRAREGVRNWAEERGWSESDAALLTSLCGDVMVALKRQPTRAARRLAQHAHDIDRILLIALRNLDGEVVTFMRRALFQAPDDDRGKSVMAWGGLCPTEGLRIFGVVDDWIQAAKEGEPVLMVEGGPDYLAARVEVTRQGFGEVIGGTSAASVVRIAQAVAERAGDLTGAHITMVPHLGDGGNPNRPTYLIGLRSMMEAGRALKRAGATVEVALLSSDITDDIDLEKLLATRGGEAVGAALGGAVPLEEAAALAPPDPTEPPHGDDDGEGDEVSDDTTNDDIIIRHTWMQGEEELWRAWSFGARVEVKARTMQRGQVVHTSSHVGDHVYPVALAEDVLEGSYGARIRYLDRAGRTRYEVVPAGSWVDRAAATREAGRLAQAGVQIRPKQGAAFVEAVGEWASRAVNPQIDHLITKAGWHPTDDVERWGWVGGKGHVFGADWVWGGPESLRGRTSGTSQAWMQEVAPLVTTPGLRIALGVGLAGALLHRLQLHPFLVHFAGASSSGKSRAGRLAASVWGPPETILTWQTTPKALAARMEAWSGASVVIDELQLMESWHVSSFVHTFSSGMERDGLRRNSTFRRRRSWSLAALSTGEVTMRTHLGDKAQGGHAVRGVDISIQRGDLTTSALHADQLARACRDCCGSLGLDWAAALTELPRNAWDALAQRIDDVASLLDPRTDAELGRIVGQVAVVVVALELAATWGLAPRDLLEDAPGEHTGSTPTNAIHAGQWAVQRIRQTRGIASCPEARAWAALQRLHTQQPNRFPSEGDYNRARDVVGITEPHSGLPNGSDATVLTRTKLLIIDEVTHQVTPRDLLSWAQTHKLAEVAASNKSGKMRVAGQNAVWYRLHLHKDPVHA